MFNKDFTGCTAARDPATHENNGSNICRSRVTATIIRMYACCNNKYVCNENNCHLQLVPVCFGIDRARPHSPLLAAVLWEHYCTTHARKKWTQVRVAASGSTGNWEHFFCVYFFWLAAFFQQQQIDIQNKLHRYIPPENRYLLGCVWWCVPPAIDHTTFMDSTAACRHQNNIIV